MFPTEWRDELVPVAWNIPTQLAQVGYGSAEIDGVPVGDGALYLCGFQNARLIRCGSRLIISLAGGDERLEIASNALRKRFLN